MSIFALNHVIVYIEINKAGQFKIDQNLKLNESNHLQF